MVEGRDRRAKAIAFFLGGWGGGGGEELIEHWISFFEHFEFWNKKICMGETGHHLLLRDSPRSDERGRFLGARTCEFWIYQLLS